MEKLEGYDEAQAITGEYETLEAGGYICEIKGAKVELSSTNKKMLVLAIDVCEGEHAGFYQRRFDEAMKNASPDKPVRWASGGVYRQMLEGEKASGFFKGMITSLEASNEKFKWNWDESKLKGLKFGGIFGQEEYFKMDGTIGTSTKIKFIRTIQAIKDNNFKIPPLKKLEKGDSFESYVNTETNEFGDDLPF